MPTLYCRHIRPSGRRCQSPALRGKPLCFHHTSANAHHRALHPPDDGTSNIICDLGSNQLDAIRREPILAQYYANTRGPVILDFPPLEDANSVQLALSMVLTVLGQNRLDPKRAAAMLYNLQIAASNAHNVTTNESQAVREFLHDEDGTLLSVDEDPEQVEETQRFLEELAESRKETDDLAPADEEDEY